MLAARGKFSQSEDLGDRECPNRCGGCYTSKPMDAPDRIEILSGKN